MARNGSGTYNLPAGNPVVTGTTISSSTHNTTMSDVATALTGSIAANGETVITGNLDFNGNGIVLDVDADTSLIADSDDRIDVTIAGSLSIRLGHDATNSSAIYLFDGGAVTAQANTNVARFHVASSNALTVPAGTTAIAAGLWVAEPNLTATGTITDAASVYIAGVPTEGGTWNTSLWIDDGSARIDGPVFVEEQADADADVAGFGQFWVNTATPNEAWFTDDTGVDYRLSTTEAFIIAASDETSSIAAATDKVTFRMPYAFELSAGNKGCKASLNSAATTGTFTVDVHKNGTTILSTKLTFDATEKTTLTALTEVVISDTTLAEDDIISIDVDDAGAGDATGLKVTLIGRRVTG